MEIFWVKAQGLGVGWGCDTGDWSPAHLAAHPLSASMHPWAASSLPGLCLLDPYLGSWELTELL